MGFRSGASIIVVDINHHFSDQHREISETLRSNSQQIAQSSRHRKLFAPQQSNSKDVLAHALRTLYHPKAATPNTQHTQPADSLSNSNLFALKTSNAELPAHAATILCEGATTVESNSQGKSDSNLAPHVDRRFFPRRASRCRVTICRLFEHANNSAFRNSWRLHSSRLCGQLSDISRSGIAFSTGQPLHVNESLLIRITNPMYDRSLVVRADVQRLGRKEDENWLVVCRFQKALSFDEVQFFGSHLFRTAVV